MTRRKVWCAKGCLFAIAIVWATSRNVLGAKPTEAPSQADSLAAGNHTSGYIDLQNADTATPPIPADSDKGVHVRRTVQSHWTTPRPQTNEARLWLKDHYDGRRRRQLDGVIDSTPGDDGEDDEGDRESRLREKFGDQVTLEKSTNARGPCVHDSVIIRHILNPDVYNRHKVPGGEVEVSVELLVQEITTISDITSDFQLDIYISEMWYDGALVYESLNPCKRNLSLNSALLEDLWTPNSCFVNSKTASIHESPFPNIFLMIYPNGTVWTNYRLKLSGPCDMDLTTFPFDNVTCTLIFESFNYNIEEVQMRWTEVGVDTMRAREKMELADYALSDISNYRREESFNYNIEEVQMRWTEVGVDTMRAREKMEMADYALSDISNYRREEVLAVVPGFLFDNFTHPYTILRLFNYNIEEVQMRWTEVGVDTMRAREKMELADYAISNISNYRREEVLAVVPGFLFDNFTHPYTILRVFNYNIEEVQMRWTEVGIDTMRACKKMELADYALSDISNYRREEVLAVVPGFLFDNFTHPYTILRVFNYNIEEVQMRWTEVGVDTMRAREKMELADYALSDISNYRREEVLAVVPGFLFDNFTHPYTILRLFNYNIEEVQMRWTEVGVDTMRAREKMELADYAISDISNYRREEVLAVVPGFLFDNFTHPYTILRVFNYNIEEVQMRWTEVGVDTMRAREKMELADYALSDISNYRREEVLAVVPGFLFDNFTHPYTILRLFNYNIEEVQMRWTEVGVDTMRACEKMELADYAISDISNYRREEVLAVVPGFLFDNFTHPYTILRVFNYNIEEVQMRWTEVGIDTMRAREKMELADYALSDISNYRREEVMAVVPGFLFDNFTHPYTILRVFNYNIEEVQMRWTEVGVDTMRAREKMELADYASPTSATTG